MKLGTKASLLYKPAQTAWKRSQGLEENGFCQS